MKNLKIEFLLLKGEDTKCNSIVTLKNLLTSDGEVSFYRQTLKVDKSECIFKVNTNLVQDGNNERYFLIALEKNTDSNKEKKHTEELIIVFKKIKQIIIDSGKTFKIAPLWDDTAFYFSKLSYPLIYEVENLMRQLIYKFMLTKLGSSWFKNAIPEEFRTQINKREREATNAYFEASLYNADFIHVINFLFGKYTVDTNKTFNKIKSANRISELTLKELKQVVPEDNWTRYFQPIIAFDKFKEKWERLYELRCKIAHNTLITKGDYEEILSLSKDFKNKIEKAISLVANITVLEEDKAELSHSAVSSFYENYTPPIGSVNLYGTIDPLKYTDLFNPSTTIGNFFKTGNLQNPGFISGINSEGLSNNIVSSSFLKNYLFPSKICTGCGKSYIPNEITLSTLPGVCDECKKLTQPTQATLVTQ